MSIFERLFTMHHYPPFFVLLWVIDLTLLYIYNPLNYLKSTRQKKKKKNPQGCTYLSILYKSPYLANARGSFGPCLPSSTASLCSQITPYRSLPGNRRVDSLNQQCHNRLGCSWHCSSSKIIYLFSLWTTKIIGSCAVHTIWSLLG